MNVPAPAKRLLDFIGSKEAPKGYGTVFGNKQAQLVKPLTLWTVDEIIGAKPTFTARFGSSACGRYQFMRGTLANLKAQSKVRGSDVLSPTVQDSLGYALLRARGYDRFMAGTMSVTAFGLALAQEWASFPVLADCQGAHRRVRRGQTYYLGDGLNKVLATADEVEDILSELRPEAMVPLASLPRVQTIQPAGPPQPHGLFAKFGALFSASRDPAANVPVIAGSKGDPTIYYVQKTLKEKAYYTKGFLDGIDGGLTQGAVAQARKDNGMGDGGIDTDFLAKLPTFSQRPVSPERATVTVAQASEHVPALFSPPKWLVSAGLGAIGLGGADGAQQSGLLGNVQNTVAKANDAFSSVQTAFGYAAGAVSFVVEHRMLFLIGIGLILVWKGVSAILSACIKVRQAFF